VASTVWGYGPKMGLRASHEYQWITVKSSRDMHVSSGGIILSLFPSSHHSRVFLFSSSMFRPPSMSQRLPYWWWENAPHQPSCHLDLSAGVYWPIWFNADTLHLAGGRSQRKGTVTVRALQSPECWLRRYCSYLPVCFLRTNAAHCVTGLQLSERLQNSGRQG
jgi:hypothetical protein